MYILVPQAAVKLREIEVLGPKICLNLSLPAALAPYTTSIVQECVLSLWTA